MGVDMNTEIEDDANFKNNFSVDFPARNKWQKINKIFDVVALRDNHNCLNLNPQIINYEIFTNHYAIIIRIFKK